MARWLAENSMLTQRGIEILNKIKAGNGKITVTKIVAGSGRVSTSQLFSLSTVSGTQKQMTLSKKTFKNTGSEISIYIKNTDFTEPFTLQQIGVYVTHPDYSGEQLYHISQCEADGADVIPALGDTPTTFGYNLFLEHSNSSAIEITVDTQGMVSVERFDSFVGGIAPNNLVVADEEGNLTDSGKTVSELYNPNLLTNAYFQSPVNRKDGYVYPIGLPYYSDKSLSNVAGTTTTYTQVTRVNSTYGFITISWVDYYVPLSDCAKGYCSYGVSIDRWKITNGPFCYAILESNGVRFGNSGDSVEYIQHNTGLDPRCAIGRRLTVSMLTGDGELLTETSEVYDGNPNWGIAVLWNSNLNVYVALDGDSNFFGIQMIVGSKLSLVIKAMKLEFGTQQTLAHKDSEGNWVLNEIPDFAQEMSKCVQYSLTEGTYLGDTPSGYVDEDILRVHSEEELDARLELAFSKVPDGKCRYLFVTFANRHSVLGENYQIIKIFRATNDYGVIKAFSYADSNTVSTEFTRSKYNGSWTPWAKNYTSYSKPTLTEIGAFGSYANETGLNLDGFTSFGSKRVVNAVNRPSGTSDQGLAWNMRGVDAVYVVQYYLDAISKIIYQRVQVNSVWSGWTMGTTSTVVPATVE